MPRMLFTYCLRRSCAVAWAQLDKISNQEASWE
jgi:hypothetical protein